MRLNTDELAICCACGRWVDPYDQCHCDHCGQPVHDDCGTEYPDGRFFCPSCRAAEENGELE